MVTEISTGVAEAVTEMLRESGVKQSGLSQLSGIPRTTLQRRLVDGDFTVTELAHVAMVLNTTPEAILARGTDILTRIAS